jgi:oxygen-dependent protoporphyrinogen oxidase
MNGTPDVGAVVVGGGAAGLAAALELQEDLGEVLVLDASDRPGGVMRTDHVSGYVVERGPNTFSVKAPMLDGLRRHSLESALVKAEPASRLRYVVREGELVPVPLSPVALARTPLLTARGKLRVLTEPLRRRRDGRDETVAEFVTRRLGHQVVSGLVGPFLTGVYAGDEAELGAEAVFGQLVDFERRYGSIALGGLVSGLLRRGSRGLRGSYAATHGLGPFARSMAERLNEPPAVGATVRELRREGSAWHLSVSSAAGDTSIRAERVVLAVPAYAAALLLRGIDARAGELADGVSYAPIVTLPIGVARKALRREVRGFGFLAPRDAGLSILGCLYMSQLFPGRAPKEHELLHCMLGGTRWPEVADEPEDWLLQRALADLDQVLGLDGEAQNLGVCRWPRAIPQPGRDHVRRIRELRARVSALPGLAIAGSWVDGISVPDTFASGLRAARDLSQPI